MIKARNKKLSLILVLAMLVTMFAGLGTASASSEYLTINGSYTYVDADDNQTPGTIKVANGDDYGAIPEFDTIYAEVTLPDGVTLSDSGDESFTVSVAYDTNLATTLTALNAAIKDKFTSEKTIDIDSDFTGSATASVEVWGTEDDSTVFDITDNATIAKVSSGDVTVTGKDAKEVSVGDGQVAAKITVKESNPGALGKTGDINLTIKGSGVTWDGCNVTGNADMLSAPDTSDKTYTYIVNKESTGYKASITFAPILKVQPGATGDVTIKVTGDDIDTTELTVATVGEGTVAVTVDKADKDTIYQGQTATLDDVDINLDPSKDLDTDNYVTLTLPTGFKWADVDDWNKVGYMNEANKNDEDAIDNQASVIDTGNNDVYVNDLYNDDKSLWLSIADDATISSDFDLTELKVVADGTAPVGDLKVTLGGAASGDYTIAKCAAPFTVTAAPVSVATNASDIAGGKITITEADDGALIQTEDVNSNNTSKEDGVPQYFDITLPMGVTFAEIPDIDVTDGDLDVGALSLSDENNVLQIPITEPSNVVSTIELTNVKYDIDNRASAGDIIAKVGKAYNLVSSTPITTVKLGTIGTVAGASFVIGASTYTTADGTVVTCVAPSFISNSRSYLAIRDIAHVLGINDSNILWDGTNNTVTLMKGDKVVQLKVGSNVMLVNGVAVTMDTTVQNVNSRTFLPAAFVAQAFGATATWDGATSTVTIK